MQAIAVFIIPESFAGMMFAAVIFWGILLRPIFVD